jgi:DNA primase
MSKRSDRIKNQVPLDQVLSGYGYNVRTNGSDQQFSCDLHGSGVDTKPSARYYHSTKTWYCFACGKVRDVVSTVMEKEGVDYSLACRMIEKKYGLSEWQEYEKPDVFKDVDIEDGEIDWQAKTINKLSRITKEKVLSLKECLKLWEAVDFLLFAKKTDPELWLKIYRKLENDRQQ